MDSRSGRERTLTGLEHGDVVAGCRIETVAGRGGMGVVYRATQLRLDRTVAFKAIAPELARDPDFRERFQREARLAAAIEHPNVIPIYEADELPTGELYLVMRWVDGTDLRALLRHEHRLPAPRAVGILAPVALALDAAHGRGLVHRDVKPANVLIASGADGRGEHVYLTDFGIAHRPQEDAHLTRTGVFVGTIAYAAPERIQGERGGPAADIYALGCMAYEVLAGYPPFRRDTEIATMNAHLSDPVPSLRAEVADVPAGLEEVIAVALAKDPSDRFASAGEMASALEAALAGEPSARPPVPAVRPERPADETVVSEPAAGASPGSRSRARWRPFVGGAIGIAAVIAVIVVLVSGGGGGGSTGTTSTAAQTASGGSLIQVTPITQLAVAPGAVAVAPGGNNIAVAEPAADAVVILHRDGHAPSRVSVGGAASAVAADPSGRLWVLLPGEVRVLSGPAGTLRARIPVGSAPSGIAFGGGLAWIADARANDVRTISLASLRSTSAPIPTSGQGATAVAYGADGTVWVANRVSSDVSAIRNRRAVGTTVIGGGPVSIASSAAAGTWVGTASGQLVPVAGVGRVGGSSALNAGPVQVAAVGGDVWALSRDDASLALIAPDGRVRARRTMSPAESPGALSCIPGSCVVTDAQTRQVVGARS